MACLAVTIEQRSMLNFMRALKNVNEFLKNKTKIIYVADAHHYYPTILPLQSFNQDYGHTITVAGSEDFLETFRNQKSAERKSPKKYF